VQWKKPLGLLLGLVSIVGCKSRSASQAAATDGDAAPAAPLDPATMALVETVDSGEPGVTIIATRYETLILNRPELKRDVLVDGKEVIRLGILRKGQKALAKSTAMKAGHCTDGWFQLVPSGGWVCSRHVTTDPESKELKDAPRPPSIDKPLPYEYGLNLTHGTPQYRRPPLRKERTAHEKGLLVGKSARADTAAEDRAAAAKEIAAEKGGTPWYLSDDPRSAVALDGLKGDSQLVERRMVRGFYVALDQVIYPFAGKMWRSTRGSYIPFDHLLVHQTTTDFEGVWVGHDDEPRKLPLAFVLRGTNRYTFSDKGPKKGDAVPRWAIIPLTGKAPAPEQRGFSETSEGYFLRDEHVTVTKPGPPPPGLKPGEKWIDVNLSTQSLVAFEGDKPVFATIVSTGRHDDNDSTKDHRTPSGNFRVREKHISNTMDDDTASDGPYSIEDVPWVMYFEKGYALHGAFWHSSFGKEHSHGCINMQPFDARQIFRWIGPTLPEGWHAVRATPENEGARVIVHE
jgi:hypothetical protein